MTVRTLMLSGLMAVLTTLPAAATNATVGSTDARAAQATNIQVAAGPVVCMTDEGEGRMKPCDSGYKTANPNWESTDNCMTDEGEGRFAPCDSGYKRQRQLPPQQQERPYGAPENCGSGPC
jgi:hypothetical protein